jgi:inorganic phosphate transporter, PiT family
MLSFAFLAFAVMFLAFSNGANDNLKGVATVYGSKTLSYKQALTLATVAQILGSLTSLYFADSLVKAFSGSGLIDPAAAATISFLLPVALAAGATVIVATRFGMPISTTHALIGSLIGAGLILARTSIQWQVLSEKFVAPLLLSPFIGIALTMLLYQIVKRLPGYTANAAATSGSQRSQSLVNAGHFTSAFALCFARAE